MLRLRLLGTLDLASEDGRDCSALLAQTKRVALLAYLAAARPRGFHRRDRLLPLLWPESDQSHARLALRQALHGLREALGDGVVVSRGDEEVGVDPHALWCDVTAFDDAVTSDAPEEVLALYRGELLQGFFVAGASELERWIDAERTRLHEAAISSARALVARAESSGDIGAAIERARQAIRLAPRDEMLMRRLILLLDRAGDRAGAVHTYDVLAQRLAAELEVEPAPETKALIERVKARQATSFDEPAATDARGAHEARETLDGAVERRASIASRSRRGRRASLMAGVAALILISVASAIAWRARAGSALDPRRVAVAAFVNATGDSSLSSVGALAADWISSQLVGTGLVQVADGGPDPGGPSAARRTPNGVRGDARALALATGSGVTVSGSTYARGDSIEFDARITDEVHHTVMRTIAPVVGSVRDPRQAIAMLGQRVLAALAAVTDPKLGELATLSSQPPTYEAYVAFATGAEAWYDEDDAAKALPYFYRSAQLDSSFTLPLVWAAWAHRARGECEQTDSIGRVLAARPVRLARVDELYLERELAFCQGNYAAAYRTSQQLVAALPASEAAASELGRDALAVGRARAAVEALAPLHPDRGALRGHRPYHLFLTTAYHLLDEHDHELAAARRARAQFPNVIGPIRMQLLALAGLGREQEALALLQELSRPGSHRNPVDVMRETGLELRTHGHPRAAGEAFRRGLEWANSRPDSERASEVMSLSRLRLLYASERWAEARALADSLALSHPGNARYLGMQGALAAQRGDREAATRVDSQLAARWTRPPLRGEASYWRACIAARSGRETEALRHLQGAAELGWGIGRDNGNLWLMAVHTDPCFDSLRGSRAFQMLVRTK